MKRIMEKTEQWMMSFVKSEDIENNETEVHRLIRYLKNQNSGYFANYSFSDKENFEQCVIILDPGV